ncbi:MAG: cytochrome d ubiquinol oxidase subunit II, partial [Thermanaerothrix sp.]|nr:cytochrome d ubiquinol oxidase subunit II [Thermanaerothrix sp.]
GWFIYQKQDGWAFAMTTLTVILAVSTIFLTLYPRVLVSSLDPNFSLTIYNSASGVTTLRIMTLIALLLVPFVLVYQGWSYWVFRRRITGRQEELHY